MWPVLLGQKMGGMGLVSGPCNTSLIGSKNVLSAGSVGQTYCWEPQVASVGTTRDWVIPVQLLC